MNNRDELLVKTRTVSTEVIIRIKLFVIYRCDIVEKSLELRYGLYYVSFSMDSYNAVMAH